MGAYGYWKTIPGIPCFVYVLCYTVCSLVFRSRPPYTNDRSLSLVEVLLVLVFEHMLFWGGGDGHPSSHFCSQWEVHDELYSLEGCVLLGSVFRLGLMVEISCGNHFSLVVQNPFLSSVISVLKTLVDKVFPKIKERGYDSLPASRQGVWSIERVTLEEAWWKFRICVPI